MTGYRIPAATRPPYAGTRPPRLADDSPGFLARIGHGWTRPDVPAPVAPAAAMAAAAHRARLSARFPGRTLVLHAGRARHRNGDADYAFRPDSDFVWATSCDVEGAVLVLRHRARGHDPVLYLPRPAGPGERDFYASAAHGELWVGHSPDLAAWSAALDVPVRPVQEYATEAGAVAPDELADAVSDLRMIKDDWEIGQLREAVDHTVTGFASVAAEVPRAVAENLGERWLQGTFDRHARTVGNGPGYRTIVGAGDHATTLHWVRCDGAVRPGQLLLLDMGVETTSLYTADVTRTIPVDGAYTGTQRAVHDLVERAHRAAMDQVRPGRQYSDFHFRRHGEAGAGTGRLGTAARVGGRGARPAGPAAPSVRDLRHRSPPRPRRARLRQISLRAVSRRPAGTGHGADRRTGPLLPPARHHYPPELRGIGVRIEDDLLVTAGGHDVLSGALPIEAAGLERWTREPAVGLICQGREE
jgi:Xaa-Pro aminopeptidase